MMLKILLAALLALGASALLLRGSDPPTRPPPVPASPPPTAAEARFWAVVEATTAKSNSQSEQAAALRSELEKLGVQQIEEFDRVFAQKMRKSYRWDLWGAAYVIHGGASDDGFEYFRRWLISRGRAFFEHAVANPDALAEIIPADADASLEFEEFSYVATEVWAAKTGRDAAQMPMEAGGGSTGPAGKPFEEDETWLAAHYPKLWRRFGTHPLG